MLKQKNTIAQNNRPSIDINGNANYCCKNLDSNNHAYKNVFDILWFAKFKYTLESHYLGIFNWNMKNILFHQLLPTVNIHCEEASKTRLFTGWFHSKLFEYILFFRKSKSITRGNIPVNSNWSCMGGRKLGCIFSKSAYV